MAAVGAVIPVLPVSLVATDGLYTPAPADLPVLRYYANAIEHLLPAPTGDASFG
jgi:hypothetical protein